MDRCAARLGTRSPDEIASRRMLSPRTKRCRILDSTGRESRERSMKPVLGTHTEPATRCDAELVDLIGRETWSRGRELNPRPTDYESVALPLSYPGVSAACGRNVVKFIIPC